MSDSQTATRSVEGQELPVPGTFTLDPAHSHVGFSVRHMMIAKVRGRFASVSGTIEVAEDPARSTVEVDVDLDSIDTRDETRDGHLRSADFFDVENHPKMTFRSTGITSVGNGAYRLDGDLSLHGVTKPLSLEVTFNGLGVDPWGSQRIGFDATGEIDREDFGLTWNQALETGGVLVGTRVALEIEAEFVRQ